MMKSRKPTEMRPMIPITRAAMRSGRWRDRSATAEVHPPSIRAQRSIEPSCEPQEAASR